MMPLEVSNHHFLLLLRFESGHWQLGDAGRIYCRNGKTLLGGDRQIGFPPKTEANHELEKWKEKQKGKIKIETQTNKQINKPALLFLMESLGSDSIFAQTQLVASMIAIAA